MSHEHVLESAVAEGRDELTAAEAHAYVAAQARQHFDLSLEEFVQRARDGSLPEDDAVVVHLVLLSGAKLPAC
ncbi:MAG: hypothetical protein OSA99_14545 [Acidimicrobiales bacterium]|nr:hypothetical protein [Acidimicrobiales bacterium]